MTWTIYRRTMRPQLRSLIGWGIALVLIVLVSLASYPALREQAAELQQLLDNMPPAMQAFLGDLSDVTSGPGFIRGRIFALVLPLLLIIYAVGRSADAIAGEEERGALDLQLAHPNTRRGLLLQKALAIATGTTLLTLPVFLMLLVANPILDLGLDAGRLILTTKILIVHTFAVAAIALAVGASTGRRAWAVSSAILVAAAGYIIEGLGNVSDAVEPFQVLSTFHHYGGGATLTTQSFWPGALVLTGATIAALVVALVLFERRDIGTA